MVQYLVTIFHPENYDPSLESEEMGQDIDALNEAMIEAGARFFAGGLYGPECAVSFRPLGSGEVESSEGPYLKNKEYIGGLWILEAKSLEEAKEWGRKAAIACRVPVEVRPFH